jgi:hypothetical protein
LTLKVFTPVELPACSAVVVEDACTVPVEFTRWICTLIIDVEKDAVTFTSTVQVPATPALPGTLAAV